MRIEMLINIPYGTCKTVVTRVENPKPFPFCQSRIASLAHWLYLDDDRAKVSSNEFSITSIFLFGKYSRYASLSR
jgi:endogenous inhibitor of DNA gyrase (YacG/DUF329 family)